MFKNLLGKKHNSLNKKSKNYQSTTEDGFRYSSRAERRMALGLRNPAPHSTKIGKHTDAGNLNGFHAFRTNRFN